MPLPVAKRLQNQAIYVDRTIHCGQRELRKQFKEKVTRMGGRLVDEVDDADIILVDPVQTTLDETFEGLDGAITMYHYIDDCFKAKNKLAIGNYRMSIEPSAPSADPSEDAQSTSDVEIIDVRHEKQEVEEEKKVFSKVEQEPEPATTSLEDVPLDVDDDDNSQLATSPSSPSSSRCSTRTRAPVPSFRMPQNEPFSYKEVRDWAWSVIKWSATHLPHRSQTTAIHEASAHMSGIAPEHLKPTSFRGYFYAARKMFQFAAKVKEIIRSAREEAERLGTPSIGADHITSLIRQAREDYRAQYHSLPLLSKPTPHTASSSAHISEDTLPSTSLDPPGIPAQIYHTDTYPAKRLTRAGHAYMEQLWRWLLLRDPMKKWTLMEKDAATASGQQVTTGGFRKYRQGEGKSTFSRIQNEYRADPAAFAINYQKTNKVHSRSDDDSPAEEPDTKRRRVSSTA